MAALGLALCLVLLLLHPAPANGAAFAAVLLLPVSLFGLVLLPRSLWPASDLEQRFALPILCRVSLFQRPPPSRKN
ncbi:MAG TPA: hypothetical protein VIY53_06305 [Acidobacteriaceae bacterium]